MSSVVVQAEPPVEDRRAFPFNPRFLIVSSMAGFLGRGKSKDAAHVHTRVGGITIPNAVMKLKEEANFELTCVENDPQLVWRRPPVAPHMQRQAVHTTAHPTVNGGFIAEGGTTPEGGSLPPRLETLTLENSLPPHLDYLQLDNLEVTSVENDDLQW